MLDQPSARRPASRASRHGAGRRGLGSQGEERPQGGAEAPGDRLQGISGAADAIGVSENEPNIRNKLARGRFTAVFMVQVMAAIGAETIRFR